MYRSNESDEDTDVPMYTWVGEYLDDEDNVVKEKPKSKFEDEFAERYQEYLEEYNKINDSSYYSRKKSTEKEENLGNSLSSKIYDTNNARRYIDANTYDISEKRRRLGSPNSSPIRYDYDHGNKQSTGGSSEVTQFKKQQSDSVLSRKYYADSDDDNDRIYRRSGQKDDSNLMKILSNELKKNKVPVKMPEKQFPTSSYNSRSVDYNKDVKKQWKKQEDLRVETNERSYRSKIEDDGYRKVINTSANKKSILDYELFEQKEKSFMERHQRNIGDRIIIDMDKHHSKYGPRSSEAILNSYPGDDKRNIDDGIRMDKSHSNYDPRSSEIIKKSFHEQEYNKRFNNSNVNDSRYEYDRQKVRQTDDKHSDYSQQIVDGRIINSPHYDYENNNDRKRFMNEKFFQERNLKSSDERRSNYGNERNAHVLSLMDERRVPYTKLSEGSRHERRIEQDSKYDPFDMDERSNSPIYHQEKQDSDHKFLSTFKKVPDYSIPALEFNDKRVVMINDEEDPQTKADRRTSSFEKKGDDLYRSHELSIRGDNNNFNKNYDQQLPNRVVIRKDREKSPGNIPKSSRAHGDEDWESSFLSWYKSYIHPLLVSDEIYSQGPLEFLACVAEGQRWTRSFIPKNNQVGKELLYFLEKYKSTLDQTQDSHVSVDMEIDDMFADSPQHEVKYEKKFDIKVEAKSEVNLPMYSKVMEPADFKAKTTNIVNKFLKKPNIIDGDQIKILNQTRRNLAANKHTAFRARNVITIQPKKTEALPFPQVSQISTFNTKAPAANIIATPLAQNKLVPVHHVTAVKSKPNITPKRPSRFDRMPASINQPATQKSIGKLDDLSSTVNSDRDSKSKHEDSAKNSSSLKNQFQKSKTLDDKTRNNSSSEKSNARRRSNSRQNDRNEHSRRNSRDHDKTRERNARHRTRSPPRRRGRKSSERDDKNSNKDIVHSNKGKVKGKDNKIPQPYKRFGLLQPTGPRIYASVGIPPRYNQRQLFSLHLLQYHVEKSITSSLNCMYKFEKYTKNKVDSVARQAIGNFQRLHGSGAWYSVDDVSYEIKKVLENPSKEILDKHTAILKKEHGGATKLDENNLNLFLRYRTLVFQLSKKYLKPTKTSILHSSSKIEDIENESDLAYPMYCGIVPVLIKLWNWREQTLVSYGKLAGKKLHANVTAHLKECNKNVENCMEDIINLPPYDIEENLSCSTVEHIKTVIAADAVVLDVLKRIVKWWCKGYYHLKQMNDRGEVTDSQDDTQMGLVVLDEVFSDGEDEQKSVKNAEKMLKEETMDAPTIDLF